MNNALFYGGVKKSIVQILNAEYRFEDNGNDESGVHDMSLTNPIFTPGSTGKYFSIPNENTFGAIPAHQDFNMTTNENDLAFSVEFDFMKSVTKPSDIHFIITKQNGNNYDWSVLYSLTQFSFLVKDFVNDGFLRANFPININNNQFYKVKAEYDGSALKSGLSIEVDGVLNNTDNLKSGEYVKMRNVNSPVYLSRYSVSPGFSHFGGIDNLKVKSYNIIP